MVGTIEDEFRTAGDAAKFTYDKAFVVYGIVIKHVILLELCRVVDKIIVDRVVANFYGRIFYYRV